MSSCTCEYEALKESVADPRGIVHAVGCPARSARMTQDDDMYLDEDDDTYEEEFFEDEEL